MDQAIVRPRLHAKSLVTKDQIPATSLKGVSVLVPRVCCRTPEAHRDPPRDSSSLYNDDFT